MPVDNPSDYDGLHFDCFQVAEVPIHVHKNGVDGTVFIHRSRMDDWQHWPKQGDFIGIHSLPIGLLAVGKVLQRGLTVPTLEYFYVVQIIDQRYREELKYSKGVILPHVTARNICTVRLLPQNEWIKKEHSKAFDILNYYLDNGNNTKV